MGQAYTPQSSKEPGAKESLPSLLGRDLDQRCAPKCNTAKIGEYIVGDDHGNGQDEPDESLKDIVDDEMGLSHNQEQSHVSPGKLGELEPVVTLLQREDEENEAWEN